MHKSMVFTFGVLLTSLVMLSVMPIVNNTNNSILNAAMAQGYDNYGDSSSYSQYPTDDKKYECRTGPFEGFFVSSVEFCKFKLDDDDRKDHSRDNKTGTQGPPGPEGQQGIQGIQGERGFNGTQGLQGERGFNGTQGPAGVNGTTDRYTVIGNTSVGFAGTASPIISSTALCDAGDVATGGSFVVAGNSTIRASQPLANETGWIVISEVFGNPVVPGAPLGSVTADVLCDDYPPLQP